MYVFIYQHSEIFHAPFHCRMFVWAPSRQGSAAADAFARVRLALVAVITHARAARISPSASATVIYVIVMVNLHAIICECDLHVHTSVLVKVNMHAVRQQCVEYEMCTYTRDKVRASWRRKIHARKHKAGQNNFIHFDTRQKSTRKKATVHTSASSCALMCLRVRALSSAAERAFDSTRCRDSLMRDSSMSFCASCSSKSGLFVQKNTKEEYNK